MIVVKIEDWPKGNRKFKTEVATIHVLNRTDEEDLTDFEVVSTGKSCDYYKDFTLENFSRKQGIFELMKAVFTKATQKSS